MRYGVLADIHGNVHALGAVVAGLASERVDRYLCLGDIVGFGPHPNQCIRRIAALGALTVAGNHDLIAVGRASATRCSARARESLMWTRSRLEPDSREYLEALPTAASPEPGLLMTHGGLGDPGRYVTRQGAVEELVHLHAAHPDVQLLLLGHTHVPMAVAQRHGRLLRGRDRMVPLPGDQHVVLNPGAVGQSRQLRPRARALVLDTDAHEGRFLVFRYDVKACRRALAAHGLPVDGNHHNPYAAKALARRARAALG